MTRRASIEKTVRRLTAILSAAAGAVALLATLGTLLGRRGLAALGPDQVPMSPLGMGLVLLLGTAILAAEWRPASTWARRLAIGLALGVAALSLGVVAGLLLDRVYSVEHWLLLGHPQVQRTSLLTALATLGAALSALLRWSFPTPSWRVRQGAALLAQIPLVLGTVVLVSYAAGVPVLYGTGTIPMSLPSALCAVGLGLALVLAAGCDAWPLAAFGLMPAKGQDPAARWFFTGPLALFLSLGVLILTAGSFYLRGQIKATRTRVHSELAAIADLKAHQIEGWSRERRAEAERLLQGQLMQTHLRRFLAGAPGAPEADVRGWMEGLQRGVYQRVALFDGQGRVRVSVPSGEASGDGGMDAAGLQTALYAKEVMVRDLHQHPGKPDIHLSLWIPIGIRPGAKAEGALLLMLDPRQFLYPLIQSWPTASGSAETLLVRRDGGDVLYLNDLRHRTGTAMALRVPLASAGGLPAARAVLGEEGLVAGRDYRGTPVLAALRKVSGTAWSMVAKVDEAEVYGPLRRRVWITGAGLIGMLALAALAMGLMAQHHHAEMIRGQWALSQRFEWLMRQANDIILLMDGEGRIQEANLQAAEHYGYSIPELQTMRVSELRAPETLADAAAQLEQLKAQGAIRFETLHRRRDGSTFPVEVSARMVHLEGEPVVVSFARDVTERVAREGEIRRMTQLYAALSQVNQAIVWSPSKAALLDRICEVLVEFGRFDMAWIGWNDPLSHQVTVAARYGDSTGYLDRIRVESGDSSLAGGPVGTAIREACPCVVNDFLTEAGTEPWRGAATLAGFASVAAFPIRQGGGVVGALAVYAREKDFFGTLEADLLVEAAMDISFALDHLAGEERRREAEAALLESERFLREAQEAGGIGTYTWDIQRDRWKSSPFLDHIFGIDGSYPRDLAGWTGIIAPAFREQIQAYVAGIIQRREPFDLDYPIVRRSDGAHRWVHGQGELHWDTEGRPATLAGSIQDITGKKQDEEARRALEAQLHHSQKLESLGSLAGGVAHDMNNVLGAILGLASTLREGAEASSPSAKSLDTIISACVRGRGVVKGLLYFAHKDLQEKRPLDLNDLVKEMSHLLGYTTLKRVQLRMDLQEGIGLVRGDGGALSHALMNLCVNAMDAMPGGGSLHISTRETAQGGLELRVKDTGEGMEPEVLAKAMEPFFTTKPRGKGTGLGLAMVYGTMKAHEGSFELMSQPGQGTEAILRFPASRVERAAPAPSVLQAPAAAPQAPLKILLVDDDELIRDSVGPMLEMLGHAVTTAPEGLRALRLLEGGLPADLVILDMNMPGMSGAEALPKILNLRPGLPVLMATGYSDQEIAPLLAGNPGVSSLRKPFSMKEIRAKIAELGIRPAADSAP